MRKEDASRSKYDQVGQSHEQPLTKKLYRRELRRLQLELDKLQHWVHHRGLRVVIIFEGRDAAGKGGTIKRLTAALNPRIVRVVALPKPTEREMTQWYFQRYMPHLPAAGEIVIFDRSWYNRAGVERVMGFCTEPEYLEFLRSCPDLERMLVRSGIKLLKYWFSVSAEEQERRFRARIEDRTKRWKLSDIDLSSRERWYDYSQAKDQMFLYTDTMEAPWFVVNADHKKKARLNCIRHFLSQIPYQELEQEEIELPARQQDTGYQRPSQDLQKFVPEIF
ncbi:MAG: polyphosphate kinase 2 [Rhodothermales bacterium]|nr:polyphosphate kinase 2 [Rhodothermales bacterium]